MRINSDIDGVLADFVRPMLDWVQAKCAKLHRYEDITMYPGFDLFDADTKKAVLTRMSHDPTFCWGIPRVVGAQQFLKDLVARGHSVHLVTSPFPGPHWLQSRQEWIESLLSSYELRGVTWEFVSDERKNLPGDFLIEDRLDSAEAWARTGRRAILVDHPWNHCEGNPFGVTRVQSLGEALEIIDAH